MEKSELNKNGSLSAGKYENEALQDQIAIIDFKMVTFSLAGKDYAIDIMQVKEIAKAGSFTFVPNTSPFVLGVYNLRGDIIPIIDLRMFFNIPVPARKKDQLESMVIINVSDQIFGIVVDYIDKVVGVASSTIQPPHPIFGDINIKYIHGVVENGGRLYILLDVNRIFASGLKKENKQEEDEPSYASQPQNTQTTALQEHSAKNSEMLDVRFISDTLAALGKFYPSSINEDWIGRRYLEWKDTRPAGNLQIQSEADAKEFISNFISPFSKQLWSESYINSVLKAMPDNNSKVINVWNIGCGQGYESYSFAVLCKKKYPNARIRIYANDSDLLAISNAPMLTVPPDVVESIYEPYLIKGSNGTYSFSPEIKDMILFEYHDCAHQNVVPDLDIILARDVLSFVNPNVQESLVRDFSDKLKKNGCIILGKNEAMPKQSGWLRDTAGDIITFTKE